MTIPKLPCPGGGGIFTPKPPNFFSEAPKVVQIPEKKFLAEYVTRLIKFISKMRLNTKMYVGAEAGDGRPVDRRGQQKQSNDPGNNQHNPQYANYWAPLTRKRHIPPHPAQPQHTNDWALRTRKRHQQEHRPQWPTESSDPTQHAKGRTGDCPGPRKGATTRRNVTHGGQRSLFFSTPKSR